MSRIRLSETSMMLVQPPETSFDAVAKDKIAEAEETGGVFNAYDEELDEWFGQLVETANAVAEERRVFLDVHSYQLTDATPEGGIKGRRLLERQDIVVTANATDTMCAVIVAALKNNPVMRCIMAFRSGAEIEDRIDVLRSLRTPLLDGRPEGGRINAVSRVAAIVRGDRKSLKTVLWNAMDVRSMPVVETSKDFGLYVRETK